MASVIVPFNQCAEMILAGAWVNTIQFALMDNTYTFSAATTSYDDIDGDEITPSTNHPIGGIAVTASITSTALDAATVRFEPLSTTFRYGICYANGNVAGVTNPVLFAVLFDNTGGGQDITLVATALEFEWHADGVVTYTLTVA